MSPTSQSSPASAAPASSGLCISSVIAKTGHNAEIKELRSADGRFRFVVEDSGSLVLYMGPDAIWAIYTDIPTSPRQDHCAKLVVQSDGNLMVVHRTHGLIWTSETSNCGPGPFRLALLNDGDCVLYDGTGMPRWSTMTSGWGWKKLACRLQQYCYYARSSIIMT